MTAELNMEEIGQLSFESKGEESRTHKARVLRSGSGRRRKRISTWLRERCERKENNSPFVQSLEEVGDDHDRKDSSIELKEKQEKEGGSSALRVRLSRRASPNPDPLR